MPTNYPDYHDYLPQPLLDRIGSVDPNYQYTPGSASLQPDQAQVRAAMLSNAFKSGGKNIDRAPLAAYGAAHSPGHTSIAHRIGGAFNRNVRVNLAEFAALMAGGAAGAGAFAGGGAASGGVGAGGNAAADFFPNLAAGAGAGGVGPATTSWIGGSAAGAGGGLSTGLGSESASSGGFFDPSGTFHAGAAGGDFGTFGAASGGSTPWYKSPWGQSLIKTSGGAVLNKLFGGETSAERTSRQFSTKPFDSPEIQRFLPPALRNEFTGKTLEEGIARLGELISNPGGLSPTVSDAIRPRLAAESQNIAQSYRGIASNQAGAAARGNLPVSIKNALSSALDAAQERAQRAARGEALTQSETLRREDLKQVYALLDALLQFTGQGRGYASAGLGAAAQSSAQRQAATMALIASLLNSGG